MVTKLNGYMRGRPVRAPGLQWLIAVAVVVGIGGSWNSRVQGAASQTVYLEVAVTNAVFGITNHNALTVDGDTRTATNITSINPTKYFLGTNNMLRAKTNLYFHIAQFPFGNGPTRLGLQDVSTNKFRLIGRADQTIAFTITGDWGTGVLVTNAAGTNRTVIEAPDGAAIEIFAGSVQTNAGNSIVKYIGKADVPLEPAWVALQHVVGRSNVQSLAHKTIHSSTNVGGETTNVNVRSAFLGGPTFYGIGNQGRIYFGTNNGPPWVGYFGPSTNGALGMFTTNDEPLQVSDSGGLEDPNLMTWLDYKTVGVSRDSFYFNIENLWTTINKWHSGTNLFSAHLAVHAGLYATGQVVKVETNLARIGVATNFSAVTAVVGTLHASNEFTSASSRQTNATLRGRTTIGGDVAYPAHTITSVANGDNSIDIGTNTYIVITGSPTAPWRLAHIVGGQRDGRRAWIYFKTGFDVTVLNDSGTVVGSETNRVLTLAGGDVSSGGNAWGEIFYDQAAQRWVFGWMNQGAVSQSALNQADTLYVDDVYGSDVSAVVNDAKKPWKTIYAASTNANHRATNTLRPQLLKLSAGNFTNNGTGIDLQPNVSMKGEGGYLTTIWTTNTIDAICLQPGDNFTLENFGMMNYLGTNSGGANALIGRTDGLRSSTNGILRGLVLEGDTDLLYSTAGTWFDPILNAAIDWRWFDCVLKTRFDATFIDGQATDAARNWHRFYSCAFIGQGGCVSTQLWAGRGEVTVNRVIGTNSLLELNNCTILAGGATNLLTGVIVAGGTVILNATTFELDTNGLVTGSSGAFSVYNTNSAVVIFRNCFPTNAVTGDGSFVGHGKVWGDWNVTGNLNADNLTLTVPLAGNRVTTNSSSMAGVVAPGVADKVWKTDGSGVPDWRDDATGAGGGDALLVNATAISDSASLSNTMASATEAATMWIVAPGADPDPDKITLGIGAASATEAGLMTAQSQTLGGAKTFSGGMTLSSWLKVTGPVTNDGVSMLTGNIVGGANATLGGWLKVTGPVTNDGASVLTGDVTSAGTMTAAEFVGTGSGAGILTLKDDDQDRWIRLRPSGTTTTDSEIIWPAAPGGGFLFSTVSDTTNVNLSFVALSSFLSDMGFGGSWDGVTAVAPSKNAVYDELVLAQRGNNVLSNLVGTVGNNVTNVASGWGAHLVTTAGTLTAHATNAISLVASNATTVQADFTGGTPVYQSAHVMRTNLTIQLTNPVPGRVMTFHLRGDLDAVDRTVTLSTNGLTGDWPISWGFYCETNGATALTATNNMGAEINILVLSNRFSAFYSPVR